MNLMAKKTKRVKSRDKLLMIIDGSNLAHRAYQKFENLKASNGKKTGLIYGFMRLLNSYIIRFNPTYVLVTLILCKVNLPILEIIFLEDIKSIEKRIIYQWIMNNLIINYVQ